ncbi:uncharacterized protein LOC142723859 [Rhinoderma darwinii]|uniref:uncharacterized protein LOC142723859 n=1 Tax=Rhinoderma darwinii TaxID=43563 RepID=UPI003F669960
MRKPQPFTIGTKLSNPKCPDSWTSGPSVARASVSQNACDCFSVYLSQAAPRSPPRGAARSHSPVACFTDGDHLNPGSLVRSIKKIALSRQMEGAALGEGTVIMSPRLLAKTAHGNCNNNNSRGLRHISPDGSDFQCDWPVRDPRMIISVAESHKTAKCPGPPSDSALSEIVRTAPPAGSLIRAGEAPSEPPNISQLSLEIKQMVDHVSRTQPPGAASVRSQLQNLRDQWKVLKKTAPNQKCAMGGATILLEFNKKADELEMWMREKEEEPPLHVLLDDNLEKLQITNKIQDLKQERIHYCNLQENINRLGQKLEKQGRPESRAASTRQKHLNRMWLRLQSPLDEYHQSLQLALEVASMWHQADTILRAMEEKSRCAGWRSRDDGRGNQDLRDIASQIMILDVTVSQVSNLHPLLSSRALHKHRQVKERWADLQRTLRTVKSPRTAPCASPSGEPGEALTSGAPKQSSVGNLEQSLLGSCSAESQTEKTNSGDVTLQRAPETFDNTQNGQQHHGPSLTPEVRHLLRELTVTSQWLQGVELLLSEPAAMRSPELIRKDLKQVSKIERELRSRASSVRLRKSERTVTEEVEVKVQEVAESHHYSCVHSSADASQFTPGSVALEEFECPEDDDMTPRPAPSGPILRRYRRRALSPILFQSPSCRPPAGTDMEDRVQMPEDCPRKCARGPLWLEPKNLPTGSTSPEPQEEAFTVNTFLNMTEQNTYQSRRVPRGSRNVVPSGRDDLFPASLPHITATMSFKSLRRKEKAQRRTIQGIMGLHSDQKPNPKEASRYRTSTWPPKQEKNIPFSGTPMDLEPFLNYVKNPLTKDIHAECVASGSEKWQHKSPRRGPHTGPSSCQHRTVGRVLTPQITEETDGLDNVHDVISTADSGNDQHPPADEKEVREDLTPSGTRSWLDALTSSSGYCRQNIHGYGKSTASPPSPELEDFIDDFEIDRLSPLVLQYLDPDWGAQEGALNSPESHEAASANCKISHSHRQRGGENTSSPVLREAEGADRAKKQLSSTRSSDHVLHTREAAHLRRDPHSLMETPPDKIVLTKTSSPPEVLHPDHEFLENDDEELEGIWNNAEKVPLLCPAQASHDTAPKEMVGVILPPVKYETLTHIEPYGQVVMGADPNVLVATFTLPASAMLATEMGTEKSPDTWKENSPCQSKSRVPAPENYHPNEISERKSVPSPQSPQPEIIQEKTADSKVIRKLDFHLMEGPLEKKHVLQVGGRKASSRTWGTFYAVLVRRTLCFYPDHKHSTKSSASAPPLHLTGAVCTPESDSTKRGDCFRLRLMDSSEYLFRTPTPESLQRWVTKLRHNSGMEDSDLLRDAALGSDLSPRFMSRSWMPDLCQSRSPRAADIVPVADSPYRKEMKNVAAEVSKHNPHHPLFLESDSAGPNRNLSTRRRRSQSFSSALYQNVTCVSGPWETSSSFSVTLRIDDPLTSRGRCHSFAAPQGETLSRHAADLKPRNKSVFRKFLRRKE